MAALFPIAFLNIDVQIDLPAAEPDRVTGLRRLYVCLTRAVSGLQVVHQQPLPPELAEVGDGS